MKTRDLTEWKKIHLPADGVCPTCEKFRGTNLGQWTLIPGHMYCKYCFMANVAHRDEQQRIKQEFMAQLRSGTHEAEVSIEKRMLEVHDMVTIMFQQSRTKELLLSQLPQMNHQEAARRHIRARLSIEFAEPIIGRYLIGPELIDKYGDRLDSLIETAPLTMVKDFGSVLTTPAILDLHTQLMDQDTTPPWLERAMALYTNDRYEYPLYSCAYVQALARSLS